MSQFANSGQLKNNTILLKTHQFFQCNSPIADSNLQSEIRISILTMRTNNETDTTTCEKGGWSMYNAMGGWVIRFPRQNHCAGEAHLATAQFFVPAGMGWEGTPSCPPSLEKGGQLNFQDPISLCNQYVLHFRLKSCAKAHFVKSITVITILPIFWLPTLLRGGWATCMAHTNGGTDQGRAYLGNGFWRHEGCATRTTSCPPTLPPPFWGSGI